MKLLALDTASGQCSVALSIDGAMLHRAVLTAREHARLLLPLVDELLAEAGTSLRALDGIAFGRGPGSFTGVRIAAATTQGLAAGADLPVLPVSSLRALAAQARRCLLPSGSADAAGAMLACMDARMGEVYWAVFGQDLADSTEQVSLPGRLAAELLGPLAAGAGKGLGAYPGIAVALQIPPGALLQDAEPHAIDIASLAALDLSHGKTWIDAARAQPTYLRDNVVQAPQGPGKPL